MISYFYIISGYLIIFMTIIILYYRLSNISIVKEDKVLFNKTLRKFKILKEKFLKLIKISENELVFLLNNLVEKVLRRIKIEALKIEFWANKKLEKFKSNDLNNKETKET